MFVQKICTFNVDEIDGRSLDILCDKTKLNNFFENEKKTQKCYVSTQY